MSLGRPWRQCEGSPEDCQNTVVNVPRFSVPEEMEYRNYLGVLADLGWSKQCPSQGREEGQTKPAGHAALRASPRDSPHRPHAGCRRRREQAPGRCAWRCLADESHWVVLLERQEPSPRWCCRVRHLCPQAASGTRSPDGLGPSSPVQGGRRQLLCLLLHGCCPWLRGFSFQRSCCLWRPASFPDFISKGFNQGLRETMRRRGH